MRIELEAGHFSAVHFITEHEKCEHLHGHNWKVRVAVEGEVDQRGMVVDFLELREKMGEILKKYDHRVLLPTLNPSVRLEEEGENLRVRAGNRTFLFPLEDVVRLPVVNITVEELARLMGEELAGKLSGSNLRRLTVTVSEAPGQEAVFEHSFG
ncbi:MAG: 6-carboxytetrahydropterin synthase [Candidatus Hadarchaeales archaeon]